MFTDPWVLIGGSLGLALMVLFLALWRLRREDAAWVLGKVEKRQRHASEQGLDGLVLGFYFEHVHQFPSLMQSSSAAVADVLQTKALQGADSLIQTSLRYKGREYAFEYRASVQAAIAEVRLMSSRGVLFAAKFDQTRQEGVPVWKLPQITAYRDGGWIKDIRELGVVLIRDREKRNAKAQLGSEVMRQLKKDFSIR